MYLKIIVVFLCENNRLNIYSSEILENEQHTASTQKENLVVIPCKYILSHICQKTNKKKQNKTKQKKTTDRNIQI